MSAYGIEVKSTFDGSGILSSEFMAALFMGKATYSSYSTEYNFWAVKMITPVMSSWPLVFFTTPGTSEVMLYEIAPRTDGTYLLEFWVFGTYNVPEVYCFDPEATFAPEEVTGDYGLQLFNSDGDLKFDSRWNKRVLTVDAITQITTVPDNQTSFSPSITKPAAMWINSKYYYTRSGAGDYRLYHYTLFLHLTTNSTLLKRQYLLGKSYPSGDADKYTGLWGSGEIVTVPIIDGTRFD